MRNGKFTVHRIDDVYVVSDDGRIAAQLGLATIEDRAEWHIVAPHAGLLADRIDRMSRLLEAVSKLTATGLLPEPAASVGCTRTMGTPTRVSFQLPTPGSAADLPIDRLPANPQVRWRLKKAGITSIGQLAGFSPDELTALPGLGPRIVAAAEAAMGELGYRLKQVIA